MRRTFAFLAVTIVGLLALFTFKATPLHSGPSALPAASSPTEPRRSGVGGEWSTGTAAQTPFGPVQVKVNLTGNHLNDIQSIALPSDFALSQQISSYSGPILRQEALRAQNAQIDVVSGATYTSDGYMKSLQAALNRAHG